jgi:integrase/recombinase XerD
MSQAKVLSDQELKRVLAVVATMKHAKRNRLLVLLSFQAGMRAGEIAALKVGHVLNEDQSARDRIHLTNGQTKGNRQRTVILSQRLQKEIMSFVCNLTGFRREPDRALIMSQKGGHFSPTTLVMLFRQIYDQAGLSDARSHSGRRSFITNLANKGVSVRVVQTLAGHASMQTTQRYIDVNEGMLVQAVELA